MSKQTDFINAIAPLARAEYLNRQNWVLPSVCIAQAALESGWNTGAKTLFGIKGNGNSLSTVEYLNGKYVNVTATFKAFPNIASAVHGYYDLITGNSRYAGAVNNGDYRSAVQAIKNGGYATDPNYVGKIVSIIEKYGLTQYDQRPVAVNIDDIARKVIHGDYGNDPERRQRIEAMGINYEEVRARVNQMLGHTSAPQRPSFDYDAIARDVIRGKYGNNPKRRNTLIAMGVDYEEVRKRVNAYYRSTR